VDLLNNNNPEIQERILALFCNLTNNASFGQTMASATEFDAILKVGL
jgi:hypothetical protein